MNRSASYFSQKCFCPVLCNIQHKLCSTNIIRIMALDGIVEDIKPLLKFNGFTFLSSALLI